MTHEGRGRKRREHIDTLKTERRREDAGGNADRQIPTPLARRLKHLQAKEHDEPESATSSEQSEK